jgi:signal transduction histidine kinase
MHPTTTLESSSPPADFAAAVEVAKLRALYNFAYGLSHEINNPLANIATRAQTLLVDETDPERRRKLATIVQQAFRAHEMIADLMLFAHPPQPQLREADLTQIADTVVAELQETARDQNTVLLRTGDAIPLLAMVDPTQIAVALKAIVQNALEAVQDGGKVQVNAERGTLSAEQKFIPPPHFAISESSTPHSALRAPRFLLSVTDTGPGIPLDIRPHIFDPYFSGREAGRGLGLGLCKAWRIAELHGGSIEVDSEAGSGTTFRFILPIPSQHVTSDL